MRNNFIKVILLIVSILFSVNILFATEVALLTNKQKSELERLDKLYRNFTLVKSKFIQKDNLGNKASGWFVIEKPGKARIEYDDLPVRFIAINKTLMFQDIKMKQKSFVSIKASPFAHLLEQNVSFFDGSVIINKFSEFDDYVEITISSKEYPEVGKLTLFLMKEDASIIKWNVEDSKGISTEVFLVNPDFSKQKIKAQSIFNTQRIKEINFDDIS